MITGLHNDIPKHSKWVVKSNSHKVYQRQNQIRDSIIFNKRSIKIKYFNLT